MATQLDLANAQFIGFGQGKWNNNVVDLVKAMGLTKIEWRVWKDTYYNQALTGAEISEIDKYFEIETN